MAGSDVFVHRNVRMNLEVRRAGARAKARTNLAHRLTIHINVHQAGKISGLCHLTPLRLTSLTSKLIEITISR